MATSAETVQFEAADFPALFQAANRKGPAVNMRVSPSAPDRPPDLDIYPIVRTRAGNTVVPTRVGNREWWTRDREPLFLDV